MLRALTNIARFKFIFCYIVKYTVFKWTGPHIQHSTDCNYTRRSKGFMYIDIAFEFLWIFVSQLLPVYCLRILSFTSFSLWLFINQWENKERPVYVYIVNISVCSMSYAFS